MRKETYYDPDRGLIRLADPDKMTPQQRANWRLIQAMLDSEYERGFERGREVARLEGETSRDKIVPDFPL